MRARTILIAVAVTLTVVAVVALSLGDDEPRRPPPSAIGDPLGGQRLTPHPRPRQVVAAEADRRARRIIDRDETLAALLKGNRYKLREVAPWSHTGSREQVGLGAMIDPVRPLRGTVVFPYVCGGDPRVGSGRIRWRLERVQRLRVLLQFSDRRVVLISPTVRRHGEAMPPPAKPLGTLPGSDRCPPSGD